VTIGGIDARMEHRHGGRNDELQPTWRGRLGHFSPDGDRIVTEAGTTPPRSDAKDGKSLMKLAGGHTSFVNSAAFSPNGKLVLTASDDATARLWDADTGKPLKTVFRGHKDRIRHAVFSNSGDAVLTASNDKTARLWDAQRRAPTEFVATPELRRAAISTDGTRHHRQRRH
jgi:WD40 repeat protein